MKKILSIFVLILFCLTLVQPAYAADTIQWERLDLGLHGNKIFSFLIDPQSPEKLYAGTTDWGVVKSTDGGKNGIKPTMALVMTTLYPRLPLPPKHPVHSMQLFGIKGFMSATMKPNIGHNFMTNQSCGLFNVLSLIPKILPRFMSER